MTVVSKILPSQTGFVQGQRTHVNIHRTIKRIKLRTNKKKRVFGLFIDLKSAYNYIRHDKLFERLKDVLNPAEIAFEKAFYSRISIEYGENLDPNVRVAQGSLIWPALFDI